MRSGFAFLGQKREEHVGLSSPGKIPKPLHYMKNKTHPCCSFSHTRLKHEVLTCLKMYYAHYRRALIGKLGAMVLSFCHFWGSLGLSKNPKVLVIREPTYQMLDDLCIPLMTARLWKSLWGLHTISLGNRHAVTLKKVLTLSSNASFQLLLLKY